VDGRELGRLYILGGVDMESVEGLLADCRVHELAAGETLLEAGRPNSTMYMILEGSLTVHLSPDEDEPLATLESGQVVGELSVIDGRPVTAHVRSASAARVLAVDEETFWDLVSASHQFAANLLRLLASRMRANDFALVQGQRERRLLQRAALFDGLTGLYNRRWLDSRLQRIVDRHRLGGRPLGIMMIDVDHFKRFNDEHGHAAGDEVLRGLGRVLMNRLRPTDLCARYGGEEITVILPDTDLAGTRVAAERVRRSVCTELRARDAELALPPVTVSLGIAELAAGDDAGALLARADRALYRAKERGRDCVEG
jgi:diguanylate cyclase (GGDEF)-like protein